MTRRLALLSLLLIGPAALAGEPHHGSPQRGMRGGWRGLRGRLAGPGRAGASAAQPPVTRTAYTYSDGAKYLALQPPKQAAPEPIPAPAAAPAPAPLAVPADAHPAAGCSDGGGCADCFHPCNSCRGPLESDRAFPNFIGPISNPVLAKDPRALTEARLLFVQNWIPDDHPLGGGDFQAYGLQVRVALTERLSFIADKDGYLVVNPGNGPKQDGWLNVALGLKYAFVRDVENQLLVVGGLQYEPQTGEADAFQSHGDGVFTVFTTVGKEFLDKHHFIANLGYQFPATDSQNSSFFYTSFHLDRQLTCRLFTLVELNWFHWTDGGNRGLPEALGEGDGLLNLGTSSVAGNDLVTIAIGLKAIVNKNLDVGVAYETPISNRKDLIDHRILAEAILRY